jgi:hypothetical protein
VNEPFSLLRRQGVVIKADAKVIQIYETPKNPELFSKLFQNPYRFGGLLSLSKRVQR